MKSTICNKGITIAITALIIGLTFTPTSISQLEKTTKNNNTNDRGPFTLQGVIKVNYNASELSEKIPPSGGYRLVHINVSYKVQGLLANTLVPFIKRKWSHMPIELSIEDVPEWADIFIVPNVVYPEIDTQWKTDGALLFISVQNTTAPAHIPKIIQLCLEPQYEYLRGPLGIITLVHSPNHTARLSFVVNYYPLISVVPENDTIVTPPGQVVELPITIKNLGNAKTEITVDKLEYPDDWDVNIISNTVININQERQVSLFIRSPQNFSGNQTIRLAFTPSYYAWSEYRGVTEFISILAYY
ncbi:MAG: hypothetical protein KAV40_02675 [Thermoplasmatales archaeon]|nr:hypothetical protein [Thermoplasmatales archaeon]